MIVFPEILPQLKFKTSKALFLDRDGVINFDSGYVYKIEDFTFLPGIFELCRKAIEQNYLIIIVTNQAGIARGYYNKEDFLNISRYVLEMFAAQGISIARIYGCPHHPDFDRRCSCRKPQAAMLNAAARDFKLNLSECMIVGDKDSDIAAGTNAGVKKNFLVPRGSEQLPVADIMQVLNS